MIISIIFFFGLILGIYSLDTDKPSLPDNSCNCATGVNFTLYNYETIPISDTGAGCIGGCGGSGYMIHSFSTTVSIFKAWTGGASDGLHAIYVELFNGEVHTLGQIPSRNADSTIQFAVGETIVGLIELSGNGVGSRLGYIKFSTSAGQTFKVGDEHTPYYFPAGNSFFTGIFGQSGDDIDQLGFLLMKTITSAQLYNVQYPTLSSYTDGLSPQIYKTVLCNDDHNQSQSDIVTFQKTDGESYKWSVSVSFSFGSSISVTAGIPGIVQASASFHWDVGITASYALSVDTTKTETMSYPVVVPPRERVYGTFSWFDSEAYVPYTASLLYVFSDKSNYTFAISDNYLGAYITSATADYHSVPLKDNESCQSNNR